MEQLGVLVYSVVMPDLVATIHKHFSWCLISYGTPVELNVLTLLQPVYS